jgi:hypothetical protein
MINSSGPISKAGHRALKTSRTLIEQDHGIVDAAPYTGKLSYALGWFTGVYKGHEFYWHSGGMEAFGAEAIFFPDLKYGLTLFGNTGGSSNSAEERLMWHLIDERLGISENERFDWNKK